MTTCGTIGWQAARPSATPRHGFFYAQRPSTTASPSAAERAVPLRLAHRRRRPRSGADDHPSHQTLRALLPRSATSDRARLVRCAWRCRGIRPACSTKPRIGWAGGYVGHGVTATNLAERTLADLVLDQARDADRAAVGGPPVAQLGTRAAAVAGVRSMYLAYNWPTGMKAAVSTTSPIAVVADRIAGRPCLRCLFQPRKGSLDVLGVGGRGREPCANPAVLLNQPGGGLHVLVTQPPLPGAWMSYRQCAIGSSGRRRRRRGRPRPR